MDISAIRAEISAQSDLMDAIPINQELVTEIDRHIKHIENQLNERLIHVPAKVVVQNYLPEINKRGRLASKVDEEVWTGFMFGKNWWDLNSFHEEISFDKTSKGYGIFYTLGEVIFDLGVVEYEGVDWYVRVKEDKRETHRLTGAPVKIKLRAFQHLKKLLEAINGSANEMNLSFATQGEQN